MSPGQEGVFATSPLPTTTTVTTFAAAAWLPDFIVEHEPSLLTPSSPVNHSSSPPVTMTSNLSLSGSHNGRHISWEEAVMMPWNLSFHTTSTFINATLDAVVGTAGDGDDGSGATSKSGTYSWYTKEWPLFKQTLTMTVVLSLAYLLVLVLGIVANALVVSVIYRNPAMRTVTNYFIANLAVADILVSILVLPITLLSNLFNGE